MALIGSIEHFNPRENDITSYLERLEQLFVCNVVEQDKKVALLLTLLGGEAYGVLRDLLAPDLPSSKSYEELKQCLVSHYSPKRLVIAERYKFYSAMQESNESIKSFTTKLKNLSQYCNFGQFLSECLRDRLVCGIHSHSIKRKLLAEDNLTFERAYEIAQAMELAEGQLKSMDVESRPESSLQTVSENIDKLQLRKREYSGNHSARETVSGKSCFRCARKHNPEGCPARNWECFSCNKKGHTSRVCRKKSVNLVEQQEPGHDSTEEDDFVGFLSKLSGDMEGAEKVELELEGRKVLFEIDSGACRTVMHELDFRKYFPEYPLVPVTYNLKVITGQNVLILGETKVSVNVLNDFVVKLPLVVLRGAHKFVPLLGRDWLRELVPDWRENINIVKRDLNMCHLKVVSQLEVEKLVNRIKSQFSNVFEENESSSIKQFEVELKLKEGVKPIFHTAYDMPFALKEKVEKELLKMVKSGVLKKVSFSHWASPIVVVPKKSSDEIRICVDFKKTLNTVIDADQCILPVPEDIFACLGGQKFFSVID